MSTAEWPVSCGCGIEYGRGAFLELEYVGCQSDDVESLELRNCRCGSTIAQVVEEPCGAV